MLFCIYLSPKRQHHHTLNIIAPTTSTRILDLFNNKMDGKMQILRFVCLVCILLNIDAAPARSKRYGYERNKRRSNELLVEGDCKFVLS